MNDLGYTHMVIETYRDGGTWKHFYFARLEALWAIEQMREAHSARQYELVTL